MIWLLAACTTSTPGSDVHDSGLQLLALPAVADLPRVEEPPDALIRWSDGAQLAVEDWETERRPELLVLFQHYIYGWSAQSRPAEEVSVGEVEVEGGSLQQTQAIALGPDGEERPFLVALWLPAGAGPFPVVLGLNKCGNPTVRDQPALIDGGGWQEESCDGGAGSRASYWNIDAALAAGVGVATVHQSDFAPDDASQAGGMLTWELPATTDEDRWGTIGAWAYGLSRSVDVLQSDARVGPIVAMGHSRRGKTALWAAAQDERIAGVWAHQSGTGGAALSRHFEGETVAAVNALFPHWFNDVFPQFAGEELRLPVDQHLLLDLVAPRPLRVTDGSDDLWADPVGAEMSVDLAASLFEAVGGAGPVWELRPGDHEVLPQDWDDALDWLLATLQQG